MGDNQAFSFSGLLLLIVALGVMSLLYFTPVPPISLGIGIVLLTAILLVWNAAMRSSYRVPGTAILSRSPWVLLIAMLWLVAVSLVMVFVPFRQSDAVGWFFLVLFFGLLDVWCVPADDLALLGGRWRGLDPPGAQLQEDAAMGDHRLDL
ncbi:MAG TPA: hypothetical protein VF916_08970 [Ktedonobacterales bacterium]